MASCYYFYFRVAQLLIVTTKSAFSSRERYVHKTQIEKERENDLIHFDQELTNRDYPSGTDWYNPLKCFRDFEGTGFLPWVNSLSHYRCTEWEATLQCLKHFQSFNES
ncbi:hypothetical protein LOAG_05430 [Loa loa]|uniref:Uncharacterized protein n=1 Tax=Loa loa TaxID=7209 RepID=A0A1S0U0T3_LOALO|nr:hypothetical protein LOAG_05430 [Loa loa]EFO23054.1 hypothetical protein LOAG_05430 [Loa loa]